MLVGRQPGGLAADLEEPGSVPAAPGREMLASPAATIRHRPDLRIAERRLAAGIDLAEAKQQEAYLAYEKALLEALREIEFALPRNLKEEVRRQSLARAVADQRESVRLSQLRYQEGVISFLDVLDAQRALYVAKIELARSEAEASTDLIALYKALGGGANAIPPANS